MIKNKLEAV